MAESQQVKVVRVFLASPSADTLEARARVVKVVEEIGADPQYAAHVRLELRRWDDPARPVLCDRASNPQQDIVQQIGSPGDCDLVIGIFAHTMGGMLPKDRFPTPKGRRKAWHCTEWEVEQGLIAKRAVWVFQDECPLTGPAAKAKRESLAVSEYIERHNLPDGTMREGFNPFKDLDDLADKLRSGLRGWLHREFIGKADKPPVPLVPQGTDLPVYLARRREQWRSGAGGQLDRRFVNLKLMVDHGLEHDGPRHEVKGEYDLLAELLAERADVAAWVLVGDPGAGKSTILQHHEMTTAEAALAGLAAGEAGAVPEVCVWYRLSEYSHDSAAPAEWLRTRWPKELPGLQALRGVARVRFLLDGLNEIKAPDRDKQLEAIDRWTAWAQQQAHDADVLAPIFSVRTLDQSPLGGKDFEVRQIVVARWTLEQIQAYCAHTLGEGNRLWPAIKGDKTGHLLALSALPFNLWAQCELFRVLGREATDRAELMGGMFWQMLARRVGDAPLKVAGLLGDQDRQQIASGAWKGMLRALPEQHGCLVPWLDETMQRLHRLGRQVSVAQDDLLAGLTGRPGWATPAQWLYAVRSLQLIGEGGADEYSTEPLLRCTHQLWQEFFAARGLRDLPTRDPARLPDLRPPALKPLEEVLAKLGVQEPLPGPDPSHWEEPVKLAVQLVRDPLAWVRALEPVNLALAGRAAAACRKKAEALHGAAVFDGLRQALLSRSRDAAVDVRLRIEAGLVLGELGDTLRYEERKGPRGHRYLMPKQWVAIPGGDYTIGNDAGLSFEGPETPVTLQPFEIAFAPVTNAEFRCFVEAKGYEQLEWWCDPLARQWLKGGLRNEREIQRVQAIVDKARQLGFEVFASQQTWTTSNKEAWRELVEMSQVELTERLEKDHGANGKDYTEPQEWFNPAFNAAAQPVVGICFFEAMAYAKWLTAQAGLAEGTLRPPLEAEWEVAARGGCARRRWPWDGSDSEPGCINDGAARLQRTSPVGVFPRGDTPDGLADMGGNVWDWSVSEYIEEPDCHDPHALVTEVPIGSARRVMRGGSWHNPIENCRASFRYRMVPEMRRYYLGLRLVRLLAPHSEPGFLDHRASDAAPFR
jgi:formylglycine-generating enzyme required for sulfatase activity